MIHVTAQMHNARVLVSFLGAGGGVHPHSYSSHAPLGMQSMFAALRVIANEKEKYAIATTQEKYDEMLRAKVQPGDIDNLMRFINAQCRPVPDTLANILDGALRVALGTGRHRSWRTVMGHGRVNERTITGTALFNASDTDDVWATRWLRIVTDMNAKFGRTTWFNAASAVEGHRMLVDWKGNITLQCTISISDADDASDDSSASGSDDDEAGASE